jgi:hypothetical protein
MQSAGTDTQTESRVPRLPFWWVLAANLLVIASSIQFFALPRGEGIRPMGWGIFVFMLGGAGLVGIILGMRRCYERMPYQWAVIILGFTPVPLAFTMLAVARWLCGFVVEP